MSLLSQITNEADRNRFTVCEIERSKSPNQFENFKKFLNQIPDDFGIRLFSRTYKNMDIIKENIEMFSKVIGEQYNQRFGQQYGALLAGYNSLNNDKVLTEKATKDIVACCDLQSFADVVEETDEMECEQFLFKTRVYVDLGTGRKEVPIIDMVSEVLSPSYELIGQSAYQTAINQYGILAQDGFIYVSQKHPELYKIFKHTKWAGGWSKSLSRIPGADNSIQKKINKKNSRCVKIPASEIIK